MATEPPTPPPAPPQSMPSGNKFLLALIPLIIFGGIGFYVFLPHYLLTREDTGRLAMAQQLDDMNDMRQMVNLMISEPAGVAADGRADVYRVLRQVVQDDDVLIDLCHSARSGKGPSIEEIRAGDYTNFPYARALGKVSLGSVEKPLLWDPMPQKRGERLVAFSNGATKAIPESEFAELLLSHGVQ